MQNALALFRRGMVWIACSAAITGSARAAGTEPRNYVADSRGGTLVHQPERGDHLRWRAHYFADIKRISYLWCVPYAREVSRIELHGDAFLWWAEAAGRYARGWRPALGSLLAFRSIPRMPLGHLAVVVKIISSREILVSQANWVPDAVTRNVPVIDVSPNNDWTAVRQAVGGGKFGMVYPTYGFIYDDPLQQTIVAGRSAGSEVAEAPPASRIRLTAPNRNLQ